MRSAMFDRGDKQMLLRVEGEVGFVSAAYAWDFEHLPHHAVGRYSEPTVRQKRFVAPPWIWIARIVNDFVDRQIWLANALPLETVLGMKAGAIEQPDLENLLIQVKHGCGANDRVDTIGFGLRIEAVSTGSNHCPFLFW